MKKNILIIITFLTYSFLNGQIINERLFYTLQPQHILDSKKEDISFAYSMRILESDYNGPLIKLRKASDTNAQAQDFYHDDNDILDFDAISTYASGENLFVVTWYDQSGLARNAEQLNTTKQPQFNYSNPLLPYLQGDGSNDVLVVPIGLQTLTENGKNGSVFGVFLATDRADTVFGVANSKDRWLSHINWSNERTYFDPGNCCQDPGRWFTNNLPTDATNPGSLGIWDQYSFVRRDNPLDATNDRRILKLGGDVMRDLEYEDALRCTLDYNFGICARINSNTDSDESNSNTGINEMIMYAQGKDDTFINEIEDNQIAFWGL